MPAPQERATLDISRERAVLAAVRLPTALYDHADPFGELAALVKQAGAEPVATIDQRLDRPVSGTYMGSGKIQELKQLCQQQDATVVVFDHELSPRQIARIEQEVERKILDRSEVILDIFAGRATTLQARLQVELAQLEYTYPRLRAMWSHLERITGGSPTGLGTRGPGEQQLEIDRRLVQRRKGILTRRIKEIHDRRAREVESRNAGQFTVGLVGYTNAGKSTLFNALTTGGAYADDRLFATLTTRTRQWDLGGGELVTLSDTVGFVRDLPHNLVASFKATLQEATHADVLLLVLDVSDPAAELHYNTVTRTLDELEAEEREQLGTHADNPPPAPTRILLLNKVDKLEDNRELLAWMSRVPGAIPIQASPLPNRQRSNTADPNAGPDAGPNPGNDAPPPGHAELAERIRLVRAGEPVRATVRIDLKDSRTVAELERLATVHERDYENGSALLTISLGHHTLAHLHTMGKLTIEADSPTPPPDLPEPAGWKPAP
ncbi:MAG: GTPase HflX [Planctomycetota bacterium]